jgi:Asp-tRNA(Asn)/Glu-tRNA(Gln) amidotransferase B subunit
LLNEAAESVRASTFELRKMMVEEDGISHEMAATIAGDQVVHRFYRLCCKDNHPPREVAKWVTGELVRLLREAPLKIQPGALSNILTKQSTGELALPQARAIFELVYKSGSSVEAVIEEGGFTSAGSLDLDKACAEVISENPAVVDDIQGGKLNAVQVLVGSVMKKTQGAANPQEARRRLLQLLDVG